jgi:phenylalanyl-tRNA synthetase alpha chain
MRPEILKQGGWLSSSLSPEENQEADDQEAPNVQAWAFGLGLERLAMVLFEIPDIRLFWSQDERFWNQFEPGQITKFQPYSKYPPCYKDVSFWTFDTTTEHNSDDEKDNPPSTPARTTPQFHVNDFLDITRQVGGDLVEDVALVDTFVHPKNPGQVSHCYRITYRSMERSLTNEEVDIIQERLRQTVAQQLAIQLR